MDFKNVKPKHIIFGTFGVLIVTSAIGASIKKMQKSAAAKRVYKDDDYATAQRLYNAIYPEGKPNTKLSIFAPWRIFAKIGDQFKASPDVERVMSIARDDITAENFKKVSKGYNKLYDANLIFDLQEELDEDSKRFDAILKSKQRAEDKPEERKDRIITLAKLIYEDVHASFSSANDDLYEELYDMSDSDFRDVSRAFQVIADNKGTNDSLAQEIEDDSWSIDLDDELARRFRDLGIM